MHVFGASEGESIALKLPTGAWGVVDCFADSLEDTGTNQTLQFLKTRGVRELEFLCLTHPHADHFRGMSQLLETFTVRQFWRPGVMSKDRLKWIIRAYHQEATAAQNPELTDDAKELERIFQLVKDQKRSRNLPIIRKQAVLGTQLYPFPLDSDAEFQIWSLAPSGTSSDRYEEQLGSCFDETNRLRVPSAHSKHNMISMALLVEFGQTRLILGGDVDSSGWRDVLSEWPNERLSATAVKVSHHGSVTGYCDGVWREFAKLAPPVAVLTPFLRHRLPKREALEHIGQYAGSIQTACGDATSFESKPTPLSPIKSRLALQLKMHVRPSQRVRFGRCGLVFDEFGNCVEIAHDGSAGAIS